ncbi:MAG TPA: trypsin-like peptidase domain-containing protein [Micromonosporaceae bacterium]|nr:trypsin-like peptidase domain-containing protein [Micromonosporaceae bacterium]
MGQLEVVADGRRYLFDIDTVVVCGRSSDAHVPLTDRRVGRLHCRLVFTEGDWYLIDANSTNGTWIDRQRVDRHRILGEVTAHLGNPIDGALLFVRPYVPAPLVAMPAPQQVPPPEPDGPVAFPSPAGEPPDTAQPPLAPAAAAQYGWAAATPHPLPQTPAARAGETRSGAPDTVVLGPGTAEAGAGTEAPDAGAPGDTGERWRPAAVYPETELSGQDQPAAADPLSAQPVSAQPSSGQPASDQPAWGQPAAEQAAPAAPVSAQPASGQPYPTQPVSAQPWATQPVSADQPVSAQPASGQPAAEPWAAQMAPTRPIAVPAPPEPWAAGPQPAGIQPAGPQPAGPWAAPNPPEPAGPGAGIPTPLATGQFMATPWQPGQQGHPGGGGPGALPPGGGAPWGMPGGTITTTNSSQAAPVLVARLGNKTLIFPVGQPVRVGRDPGLEAVTDHPLVSRNYHGLINTDLGGATYTDSSTRGTYHNGKQLRSPLRITEPVTLRLGDPATGEELGITPPLSLERLRANQRRRERGTRLKVIALVVAALLLLGGGGGGLAYYLSQHKSSASTGASGLTTAELHHAETATVRLLQGTPDNYTGWGSGTVISADGLILTNAHVAAPDSPGFAVASAAPGATLKGKNPDFLTVEFTTSDASAAVAKYRARVVAVDGYLDMAVVKVYADTGGAPVDTGKLDLPYLPVGDPSKLSLDQSVTVLGYPGVSGSDSITVTSGIISTFVPDPLKHVSDPRFQLETTARVAHGNSGGAAITNTGQLVGVPSLEIPGQGSDLSWRLRSVAPAAPLIAAARSGQQYQSKVLVRLTGNERVDSTGIGSSSDQACQGSQTAGSTSGPMSVAFNISGGTTGLDVAFAIVLPDGTPVTTSALQGQSVPGLPEAVLTGSSGCLAYTFDAHSIGLSTLPTGTYQTQLLGGPNLDPLGPAASFQVG